MENTIHYRLKKDLRIAKKYFDELSTIGNIYSIGRNGTYKYGVDIDDCIRQAMQVKELIEKKFLQLLYYS